MRDQIIEKLETALKDGIRTEKCVVYLLAQIRKVLENENGFDFKYLKFYCNWVLHSKLSGIQAQEVLEQLALYHVSIKENDKSAATTSMLVIENIFKMRFLKQELESFLLSNQLPIDKIINQDWTKFLYLYASIISDSPLKINDTNLKLPIVSANVKVENAIAPDSLGNYWFRINWELEDQFGFTKITPIYYQS